MLATIFLLLAFLLFVLAAIGVSSPRVNVTAAGLASWVLAELLGRSFGV